MPPLPRVRSGTTVLVLPAANAAAELARRAGLLRDLKEAVSLVKQTAHAKFDETIVISSHLGVDPRHSDQLVRGTVVLPHGTGKNVRVLVLCKGDKQ